MKFHQCHAKRNSISFATTISKITTEIFVEICWQLKTPTRTWKNTRYIMHMTTCTRQTFPSKKTFANSPLKCRNDTKKCLGKELWRVLVVDESTDHDKPHFDLFPTTISTSKKWGFFQSARWARAENSIARHIDLFALSMRMQVILDSLRSPGFSPYMGREERRVQGLDYQMAYRSVSAT